MYEIYVAARFEASHKLTGDFGPATRTHGHTYRLEVLLRGETLKDDGTLFDIGELKGAVDDLAASLHYRDLDEIPGLAGENTTAENVARYGWESLAAGLRDYGLESLTVRVWENPDIYAAREDALG